MLFSEFKKKEVINLKDCQKLGKVCDFEFDECTGQIFKLIVRGNNKWGGLFGCEPDYVICYKDIKQIGPDIIIVDICKK
ncbi:MAG: YlmC/YmxH family sporulation protein [Lachnospiraceae bacterium]|nr:YlmC/YmxH family sporulation protein [Lachnospiraceae bacterium]